MNTATKILSTQPVVEKKITTPPKKKNLKPVAVVVEKVVEEVVEEVEEEVDDEPTAEEILEANILKFAAMGFDRKTAEIMLGASAKVAEKEKLAEEFEVEKAKWMKSSGVEQIEAEILELEAKKKALYSTPEGLKFSRGSGVRIVGGNEQTKKIGDWFEKKIASMGAATNTFLPEKCKGCPKLFGNADAVAKHSEKCKGGKKWCEEMARDTIENRKLWRRS